MRAFSHFHSKRAARRPTRAPRIFPVGCCFPTSAVGTPTDAHRLVPWVEMRLVRIDNGAINWDKQFQKVVPMVGAARLDEASADAVKEILREMFAG